MGAQPRPLKAALILSEVISAETEPGRGRGKSLVPWLVPPLLWPQQQRSGPDTLCNQGGGCRAEGQGNGTCRQVCLAGPTPWPLATLFVKQEAPAANDQWGRRADASPKWASSQAGAELI